jgi:hypothetical protein
VQLEPVADSGRRSAGPRALAAVAEEEFLGRRIAGEHPRVSDDEIDLAAEVLDSLLAALEAAALR